MKQFEVVFLLSARQTVKEVVECEHDYEAVMVALEQYASRSNRGRDYTFNITVGSVTELVECNTCDPGCPYAFRLANTGGFLP